MHHLVRYIVKVVLSTTCSNISILVTIALEATIDTSKQAKTSEVELSLVHEQRIVYVLLDYKSSITFFALS